MGLVIKYGGDENLNIGKLFEICYYNFWFSSFGNMAVAIIAILTLVLLLIFFVIPPKQIQALKVLHPMSSYVVVGVIGVLFIIGWLGSDALGLGNQSKGESKLQADQSAYQVSLNLQEHFEYQVTHTQNDWQKHQYQKFVQRNAKTLKDIQGELVEDKRGD